MSSRYLNLSLLFFFILLKVILQYLIINPVYELHRDEFLYLSQANHPALGFYSVPPLTCVFSLIIKWLGNSFFWVKFFPAVIGAATLAVAWKMADALNGSLYAKVFIAIALIFSVLLRVNMLFQPNSVDVLCWTLTFYMLVKYTQAGSPKWLLWTGVVIGVGILNKYNIIFLIPALILSLLFKPRKIFETRHFYVAIVIALVIIAPNIIWQAKNNFPVIGHMNELVSEQLVNVERLNFVKEQFIFFIGAVYLIPVAAIAFFIYFPFKPYRFIALSCFFVLAVFIYMKAKGYYAIGLYPTLIVFGCIYWDHLFKNGWRRHTRYLWPALNILLFIPFTAFAFPILSPEKIVANAKHFEALGLTRWEDGKVHSIPHDFASMLGWKEVADKTMKLYNAIPEKEKPKTLVICDNYGEAGAIEYHYPGKIPTLACFEADYLGWFPKIDSIQNVISVGIEPFIVQQYFDAIIKNASVENIYSAEFGKGIYLLRGTNNFKPYLDSVITDLKGERITSIIRN